jgi:hypothetical protein
LLAGGACVNAEDKVSTCLLARRVLFPSTRPPLLLWQYNATPLHHAAYKENEDAMQILMVHGADVHAEDMVSLLGGASSCRSVFLSSGVHISHTQ